MGNSNNRDDFSAAVKRELAGRVGWLCSFPGCRKATSGPSKDSAEKSIKNGTAAHITAAAEGGQRYDENMMPKQRSSIDNAIWMCPGHGTLIDKEVTGYTTVEIRQWKVDAEAAARLRLEQNPSHSPAGGQLINPRYSQKDIRILAAYAGVFSYNVIERIRQEPFGSIVKHEVTDPMYYILSNEDDPGFVFQDAELEILRRNLNSSAQKFLRHFGQHSGGLPQHYEYINVAEFSRLNPGTRGHWEAQVSQTQELARLVCEPALKLLTIKENN